VREHRDLGPADAGLAGLDGDLDQAVAIEIFDPELGERAETPVTERLLLAFRAAQAHDERAVAALLLEAVRDADRPAVCAMVDERRGAGRIACSGCRGSHGGKQQQRGTANQPPVGSHALGAGRRATALRPATEVPREIPIGP
jgi:hypothetical protein